MDGWMDEWADRQMATFQLNNKEISDELKKKKLKLKKN